MPARRENSQFGPYRLDELLGRGGMGEVYRAYDTLKDRVVALKLLHPGLADDAVYQERFRRESHAVARLGEPHVVPIHDWGEIDGVLFIDMRLVSGEDLRSLLRRDGALTPDRAVHIIEQVASALDAAHADGLVHRDIKPENILVGANDFAYLVDFGIAHDAADSPLTQTGTAIGSIAYMAPELFDDVAVSPASDIYALACVLFESLTGRVPHPAETVSAAIKAAVTARPPAPSTVNADVPPAMDEVIATGLDPDPARRYVSAGALAAAARAALTGAAPESAEATGRPNLSKAPPTLPPPDDEAHHPTVVSGPQYTSGSRYDSGPRYPSGPQYPSGAPYPGAQGYPPRARPAAYGTTGYPRPRRDRSLALPLIGVIAVALVGLLILGAYWFFAVRDTSTAADRPNPTVTQTVAPPQTQTETRTTEVAPPPGANQCDATTYADAALTSCPFALEVRNAYLAAGPAGQARTVTATSPVTGGTYSMTCVPTDGYVTCRGGNNAIVYIF